MSILVWVCALTAAPLQSSSVDLPAVYRPPVTPMESYDRSQLKYMSNLGLFVMGRLPFDAVVHSGFLYFTVRELSVYVVLMELVISS